MARARQVFNTFVRSNFGRYRGCGRLSQQGCSHGPPDNRVRRCGGNDNGCPLRGPAHRVFLTIDVILAVRRQPSLAADFLHTRKQSPSRESPASDSRRCPLHPTPGRARTGTGTRRWRDDLLRASSAARPDDAPWSEHWRADGRALDAAREEADLGRAPVSGRSRQSPRRPEQTDAVVATLRAGWLVEIKNPELAYDFGRPERQSPPFLTRAATLHAYLGPSDMALAAGRCEPIVASSTRWTRRHGTGPVRASC